MKKALRKIVTGIALILPVCFFASCDLTGPQGEPGADGRDAIVQDTAYAVEAALAAKTGDGDDEPWALTVSGVDISDPQAFRYMIATMCAAIEEGDIALDLSGCTGKTFAYVDGINSADKSRIVAMTLPESLTHLIDGSRGYGAFSGYPKLGRVRAPGLTYIGDYAFNVSSSSTVIENEALTEVDFPEVRHVGAYAFYHCANLSAIRLPRAEDIGEYAFFGDAAYTSFTEVDLPEARSIGAYAFSSWRTIASIRLPEVISIGEYAFAASSNNPNTVLSTVDLPKVETIEANAFRYYTAIGSIILPKVTSIGNNAFIATSASPNTVLSTVDLPKVETIGAYAFQYYTAIGSIILPEVTGIGNYAFEASTSVPNSALTGLNLPKVETIGTYAFRYYTALGSISLPEVTGIGNYAFAATSANPNTALTTVELVSVTSIGYLAFTYCTGLKSFKLGPTVPGVPTAAAQGIFSQTASGTGDGTTITISVPAASQSAYSDAGWKAIGQGVAGSTANGAINYGTNHKAITIVTYTE